MSLIYKRRANQPSFIHVLNDYIGEIKPFAKRIDKKILLIPLIILKSIEWCIYRWYKTPIRRFYGVKGNELIYMITRRCNDRCAKCGIWKNPEQDHEHLDITVFINCLKTLHENLYQVTLTGGEPLLFIEDVLLIGKEARQHDVKMIVVTNGSLITEEFLKSYSQLDHTLVISIDTLEENKWQSFRGRDHYKTVMNNIKLAKEILDDKLQIQSVLANESRDEIGKVKELCKELDIRHVVQPYMDFGGIWNECKEINHPVENFSCAARKNICVYPNGDVVKCFDHHRIPIAKDPLGNISKEDIIEILCKKRSTEVSRIMKTCDMPCKRLSCNVPEILYN